MFVYLVLKILAKLSRRQMDEMVNIMLLFGEGKKCFLFECVARNLINLASDFSMCVCLCVAAAAAAQYFHGWLLQTINKLVLCGSHYTLYKTISLSCQLICYLLAID